MATLGIQFYLLTNLFLFSQHWTDFSSLVHETGFSCSIPGNGKNMKTPLQCCLTINERKIRLSITLKKETLIITINVTLPINNVSIVSIGNKQ